MSLMTILEREMAAGLPRLAGARISGAIPLTEELLNELLPPGALASEVRLLDDNQFTVNAALWILPLEVHATLVSVDVGLNVTIELQGHVLKRRAIAFAARRLPYVRGGPGQSLIIAAGELPSVARYRQAWQYLTHVAVRTHRGTLVCEFAFSR